MTELANLKVPAQHAMAIATWGRGTYPITDEVKRAVDGAGVRTGMCHVFLHHTSASLLIAENADPRVRADLERFLSDFVTDGDPRFTHNDEGPDDMPAHVRAALTQSCLSIPVIDGRLGLGTWQGLYVWEHRTQSQQRRVTVTVIGV